MDNNPSSSTFTQRLRAGLNGVIDWVGALDKDAPQDLEYLRRRVFSTMFLVGLFLGMFVYVPSLVRVLKAGAWTVATVDTLGYLLLVSLALARRIPFRLRAGAVCLICYFIGLAVTVKVGLYSASLGWLFIFSVLAGAMLGIKAGLVALGINLITLTALWFPVSRGALPWAVGMADAGYDWVVLSVNFTFTNTAATLAVTILLRGLSNALEREREIRQVLAKERQNLADSRQRYRSLVDGVPYGMFLASIDDNRFLFLNEEACAMFGYTLDEGLKLNMLDLISPEEHEIVLRRQAARLAGQLPVRERLVYTGRRKDGSTIRFEVTVALVRYDGRPAVQGVVQDITEKERLELQLAQAQKMEAVGTLASGVAHEFNNLLTAVGGYAELMRTLPDLSDKAREHLDKIAAHVSQGAEMTRGMLSFARPDQKVRGPVELNQVVRDMAVLLKRSLGNNIALTISLSDRLCLIRGHPGQIEQILLNLALNAKDAMPTGGELTVTLGDFRADEEFVQGRPWAEPILYRRLEVSDTGKGMSLEVRERLFEPFFTTKPPGRGTGLGLSVVYNLVGDHGGGLDVESAPGGGSRFVIYLPADESELDAASLAAGPGRGSRDLLREAPPPVEDDARPLRVLVADDEPVLREIAHRGLELFGHIAEDAANGQQAVEMYQAAMEGDEPYDVVLLDLAMPVMDGWECLDELMTLDPQVRVVVITGLNENRLDRQNLEGKALYIMYKPYTLDDLIGVVDQAAGRVSSISASHEPS